MLLLNELQTSYRLGETDKQTDRDTQLLRDSKTFFRQPVQAANSLARGPSSRGLCKFGLNRRCRPPAAKCLVHADELW